MCKTFSFSYTGFALSLALKQRFGATRKWPIERFHSRGQHRCKFTGTKESFCIRKEVNSQRIALEHQYGHRDVM